MFNSILVADPASVILEPEPIPVAWVLSGKPEASAKNLTRSKDWASSLVVWECTAGRFNWHYDKDETLVVISGEAAITNEKGDVRQFGPGDVVYFPAGSSATWQVDNRIRKVAFLRESLWRPLGMALKVWSKLLRMAGLARQSPLTIAVAVVASASVL